MYFITGLLLHIVFEIEDKKHLMCYAKLKLKLASKRLTLRLVYVCTIVYLGSQECLSTNLSLNMIYRDPDIIFKLRTIQKQEKYMKHIYDILV